MLEQDSRSLNSFEPLSVNSLVEFVHWDCNIMLFISITFMTGNGYTSRTFLTVIDTLVCFLTAGGNRRTTGNPLRLRENL